LDSDKYFGVLGLGPSIILKVKNVKRAVYKIAPVCQNKSQVVGMSQVYSVNLCAFLINVKSLSIYLSIYGIYIALLQGNYSEALPAQARAKIKVLRSL